MLIKILLKSLIYCQQFLENRFLKISLNLSYYKIYCIFYLNTKKITRLFEILIIDKLEFDNNKKCKDK